MIVVKKLVLIRSNEVIIIIFNQKVVNSGAVNVFSVFLYPTYVICPGVSAVLNLNNSSLFLSLSVVVL